MPLPLHNAPAAMTMKRPEVKNKAAKGGVPEVLVKWEADVAAEDVAKGNPVEGAGDPGVVAKGA